MEYVIGLDLGQKQDYTAVALIEKHDHRERGEKPMLYLRHLERYALGTPYGQVADRVAELVEKRVEQTNKDAYPQIDTPELIVDSTGVGVGVAEMLKDRDLSYRPVVITGGTVYDKREGGVYRVAKQELVSRAVAPFESKRLKISRRMPLVSELVQELENFKIKVNVDTANASFEAWRERDHDDLVLALALACWWCERRWRPVLGPVPLPSALRGSSRLVRRSWYRTA